MMKDTFEIFRYAFVPVVVAMLSAAPLQAQYDLRAAGARLEQGRVAERSGDVEGYYSHARAAVELAPSHPVLLYHAARAAAKTGRTEEALTTLGRLVPLGAPRDPAADSAFISLWPSEPFKSRVAQLKEAAAPLVRSDTAFIIDAPNIVAENIAFDPVTKAFYVGSMARRTILRVHHSGRSSPLLASNAGIGQPLGMKVDPRSRILWATAIWPVDSSAGRLRTRSELLAISLPSGRIARRLAPADTSGPHLLNDIIIGGDGTLYISDSEGGMVWSLAPGAVAMREFLKLPSAVLYPNGIALSPDGRALFLAHQSGVIAIDIATRSVAPVSFPDGPTFMGIDGLYTGGENITAVVNSSTMDQIVHGRLARATDGKWTIVTSQSLERRHPAYEIPTTGALVGDTLFYVANSQLRRLDAKGNIRNPEIRTRTVILRLTLRAR